LGRHPELGPRLSRARSELRLGQQLDLSGDVHEHRAQQLRDDRYGGRSRAEGKDGDQ
jgi:hypothetical protein